MSLSKSARVDVRTLDRRKEGSNFGVGGLWLASCGQAIMVGLLACISADNIGFFYFYRSRSSMFQPTNLHASTHPALGHCCNSQLLPLNCAQRVPQHNQPSLSPRRSP